jgi:hypothetical protein
MPTAPPESEETDEQAAVKRKKCGGGYEVMAASDETDDSLRPPLQSCGKWHLEAKPRRSNKHKMKRSLSVGAWVL